MEVSSGSSTKAQVCERIFLITEVKNIKAALNCEITWLLGTSTYSYVLTKFR